MVLLAGVFHWPRTGFPQEGVVEWGHRIKYILVLLTFLL